MRTGLCPQCGQAVPMKEPAQGQELSCPNCRARLEILNLEPLELDWAFDQPHLFEVWEERETC